MWYEKSAENSCADFFASKVGKRFYRQYCASKGLQKILRMFGLKVLEKKQTIFQYTIGIIFVVIIYSWYKNQSFGDVRALVEWVAIFLLWRKNFVTKSLADWSWYPFFGSLEQPPTILYSKNAF